MERPIRTRAGGGLATFLGRAIALFAHLVTAVQAVWKGADPLAPGQRIYFANHASHGDFILIWAVLPDRVRRRTRPVAGADYWGGGGLKGYIGRDVFDAVLIDRNRSEAAPDPVATMAEALDGGASLILFPEGTRNLTDAHLLPFRSGLYHLAAMRPDVDLVPVWIENLNRVLPKGTFVPVPLMCKVVFGAPLRLEPGEEKGAFLARTQAALGALRPRQGDEA